jgi:hypothetical protein
VASYREGGNKFGLMYFVSCGHRLLLTNSVLRDGGQRPYIKCFQVLIYHRQSLTYWYGYSCNGGGENSALASGTIIWGGKLAVCSLTESVAYGFQTTLSSRIREQLKPV